MIFSHLAEYFDKLESTSSRLALIDILGDLFKEVKSDEIAKVIYLIQGRVAPFYESTEIGMAEQTVAASIAAAYGVSKEEVIKDYQKVGDLGKVASTLASHPKREKRVEGSKITVTEVFETLKNIAKTSGVGTVEKKQDMLVGMLKQMNGVSAKHLVRIPLGSNRLGIGDPTVLDGLALAKLGGRGKRKELEEAYNKTSDLGLLGETLFEKGIEGVKNLSVSVGRPLRSELTERLPDAKTILEKMGGRAHIQYKYDGFRVQIHLDRTGASLRGVKRRGNLVEDRHAGARDDGAVVRLFSRNLEETTLMMPEIIEGVLKQVKAKTIILDSEALAYNPTSEEFLPFQETTKRRRKYQVEEMSKTLPLKAFVFDIMYLNGKSLVDIPLEQRVKLLKKEISGEETLIPEEGEFTDSAEKIQLMFDDAITRGLEGLIIKKPDSKYEAGARNFNWVKLKRHSAGELHDTIDCVILGYIFGKGKRSGFGAGSLLVGVYDEKKDMFVTVSKIGTGLTDIEWKEIHERSDKISLDHKPARVESLITPTVWIQPEIVIEVLADEITKSPTHTAGKTDSEPGYALRFPRLVRFRGEDKRPEDATTVKEISEMYKLQYKK